MSISNLSRNIFPLAALTMPLVYAALLSQNDLLNIPVGLFLTWGAFSFFANAAMRGSINRWHLIPILAAGGLASVYVISSLHSSSLDEGSIKTILQVLLVVIFFLHAQSKVQGVIYSDSFCKMLPLISIFIYLPVIAAITYYARFLGHDDPASFWTRAKNSLAALLLCLIILNSLIRRHQRFVGRSGSAATFAVMLALLCLVLSGSRGSLLALIVALVAYAMWNVVRPRSLILIGLLAFIPLFIYCYINLDSFTNAIAVQNKVQAITSENLYSGRQLIWPSILDAVQSFSPLLGLGAGAHASTAMAAQGITKTWSSHDLYMQVYLQGGLFGCGALYVLIISLWREIAKIADDSFHRRVACAAFLGILSYDIFEVSLLQNNLSTGIALWMTVALVSVGKVPTRSTFGAVKKNAHYSQSLTAEIVRS